MGYYYYDDDDNGGGAGLAIVIFILIIPIIPIGDISIYLVDAYTSNTPNYVYIISWLLLTLSWSFLFFFLTSKFISNIGVQIGLFYLQGILFSLLIGQSKYALLSAKVYSLLHLIFIGEIKTD